MWTRFMYFISLSSLQMCFSFLIFFHDIDMFEESKADLQNEAQCISNLKFRIPVCSILGDANQVHFVKRGSP
jgi:hypothetical protein